MSRPSDLTEELTMQIRGYVLKGLQYQEIQEILDIPQGTWDAWTYRDTHGFRASLSEWKKERLIKKAEKLSDDILDTPHLTEEGKISSDIMRVKQKEAEFVRSTLGRQEYSSRNETDITSNGKTIVLPTEILNKHNELNPSSEQDSSIN